MEQPIISVLSNCTNLESNSCNNLMVNKDLIFSLFANDPILHYNYINSIDSLENNVYIHVDMNNILFQILDDKYSEIYKKIKELNGKLNINRKIEIDEYDNLFTIERKKEGEVNAVTGRQTYISKRHKILKSSIVGTSSGSPTLLINLLCYFNNETNTLSMYDTVVKVYPFSLSIFPTGVLYDSVDETKIGRLRKHINDLNKIHTDKDKIEYNHIKPVEKFENLMKAIFYREALIGCWIKDNILLKDISPTFACTYDSYISTGMPLTFADFNYAMAEDALADTKKINKRWLNNLENNGQLWENIKMTKFGYIETEKMEYELTKFIQKRSYYFDCGMIFEIIYTKLVLAFFGNVYPVDDRAENIMLKRSNAIRKYIIKYRNTEYIFYVDNPYVVKYINFERLAKISDRNKFMTGDKNDTFLTNFIDNRAAYGRVIGYVNAMPNNHNVEHMYELFSAIMKKPTFDTICDILWRYMPDKYIDETLYEGKGLLIETYKLDLDIEDELIKEQFINKMTDDIVQMRKPHVVELPNILSLKNATELLDMISYDHKELFIRRLTQLYANEIGDVDKNNFKAIVDEIISISNTETIVGSITSQLFRDLSTANKVDIIELFKSFINTLHYYLNTGIAIPEKYRDIQINKGGARIIKLKDLSFCRIKQ